MKYIFEWQNEMSVGQEVIDLQHKQLFNQINILLSAIVNKMESHAIDEAITFLGQYIDGHLKYEEEYMLKNGYPELEAHKAAHGDFINSYHKIKEKRDGGAAIDDLAWEIEYYLGKWLSDHIAKVDHKYAEYIKSHSVIN